jgi:hypothetical protein
MTVVHPQLHRCHLRAEERTRLQLLHWYNSTFPSFSPSPFFFVLNLPRKTAVLLIHLNVDLHARGTGWSQIDLVSGLQGCDSPSLLPCRTRKDFCILNDAKTQQQKDETQVRDGEKTRQSLRHTSLCVSLTIVHETHFAESDV